MGLIEEILKLAADKVLVEAHVSEDTAAFRMGECMACPRLDKEHMRCKVCKCYVEVKTTSERNFNPKRLRNEITHCPLGKWNDIEIANEYRKIDGKPLLTAK